MDRAEMIETAAPPCRECGNPVVRLEQRWQRNGDGDWMPFRWTLVCTEGHRVPVEPLD